jgi:hypothetical protein
MTTPQTDLQGVTLMPFRVLIDEAMRQARRHARAIYPWVAIPLVAIGLIHLFVQLPMMSRMMGSMQPGSENPFAFFGDLLVMYAVMFAFGIAFGFGMVAMLAAATHAVHGGEVRMLDWWLWAFRPSVLATVIVLGLVITVGLFACLLPGVVLSVLAGLTVPIMVVERRRGWQAVSRSIELVRHNPSGLFTSHPAVRLFVIFVVGGILNYLLSFLVQLPFMIVQQVMMVRSMTSRRDPFAMYESPWWIGLQVPQTVLATLAMLATSLYVSCAVALFFNDLVRRREGGDLARALDGFEAAGRRIEP